MLSVKLPKAVEKQLREVVQDSYQGDLSIAMLAFLRLHEKYGWKEQLRDEVRSVRAEVRSCLNERFSHHKPANLHHFLALTFPFVKPTDPASPRINHYESPALPGFSHAFAQFCGYTVPQFRVNWDRMESPFVRHNRALPEPRLIKLREGCHVYCCKFIL